MEFEVLGFQFLITKKFIIKLFIFLIVAVGLSILLFGGGKSSLQTTEETCVETAIAAGVAPDGCSGK